MKEIKNFDEFIKECKFNFENINNKNVLFIRTKKNHICEKCGCDSMCIKSTHKKSFPKIANEKFITIFENYTFICLNCASNEKDVSLRDIGRKYNKQLQIYILKYIFDMFEEEAIELLKFRKPTLEEKKLINKEKFLIITDKKVKSNHFCEIRRIKIFDLYTLKIINYLEDTRNVKKTKIFKER